ncbi:hypothetical protein X777_12105 [Ooceraea biroi]|uniref:Uncharacterized protein n=1 Tax=Ooceraea biroi TaxID=2015173 RepID=A0A026W0K2_OOCBI|nr:hypothetical protein X777_12105 [Ooceraea biroi]
MQCICYDAERMQNLWNPFPTDVEIYGIVRKREVCKNACVCTLKRHVCSTPNKVRCNVKKV